MGAVLTIGLLAATYAILFLFERAFPLRRAKAALLPRLWVNAIVTASSLAAAGLLVRPAAARMLEFTDAQSLGLMPLLGLEGWPEVIASFLLLDLSFYYWHVANHRVPWMWRLHNVHHIDPDLDVSTSFRFHFGEVALSAAFRAAQVLLIGPSIGVYAIYEIAFQTHTQFQHSNVRFPIRLERLLNRLIVTPRMHGIHHSNFRDETNSNFGVVFPWWDHLHRTIHLNVAQDTVTIGVPGYARTGDNSAARCLLLPFAPQREYWKARSEVRLRREPPAGSRDDRRRLAA